MKPFFLEIHVTDHCNLNCAGCSHFSPLAINFYADPDTIYKDIRQMMTFAKDDCRAIHLMGGEPLLHPDICNIIEKARIGAGDDVLIELVTNGIMLLNMSDEFWNCCRVNNIIIRPTVYDIDLDYHSLEIKSISEKVGFRFYSKPGEKKVFKRFKLSRNGKYDPDEMFELCGMNDRFLLLKQGILSRCSLIGNIEILNKYFCEHFETDENDFIDIYKIESKKDLETFLESSPSFCRFCNAANRELWGWALSEFRESEWIEE